MLWKLNFSLFGRNAPNAHTHICHPPRRPVPLQALPAPGQDRAEGRARLPPRTPAGWRSRCRPRGEHRGAGPARPSGAAPAARAAPLPRRAPREGGMASRAGGREGRTHGYPQAAPARRYSPLPHRRRDRSEPAEPWGSAGRGRGRRGAGGGGSALPGRAEVAVPRRDSAAPRSELPAPRGGAPGHLGSALLDAVGGGGCSVSRRTSLAVLYRAGVTFCPRR